jgi:hypothetical protein
MSAPVIASPADLYAYDTPKTRAWKRWLRALAILKAVLLIGFSAYWLSVMSRPYGDVDFGSMFMLVAV